MFYNRVLDELAEHEPGRFPAARSADRRNRYVRFLIAPPDHAMALPVAAGQRAPAPDRRPGRGRRRAATRQPVLSTSGRATRSCRSSSAGPPIGSDTAWSGPPTAPTSPAPPATAQIHRRPVLRAGLRLERAQLLRSGQHDRADLLGGYPAPRRYIGWQTFFDLGDGQVKNNKKIDTTISSVLFKLPLPAIAPHTQTAPPCYRSATCSASSPGACPPAKRSPSHARRSSAAPNLSDIADVHRPFGRSTPLWYYVLAEAKTITGGVTSARRRAHRHRDTGRPAPRRPDQLPQRPPTLPALPRHRPETRSQPQSNVSGQPRLHPRALPPLRRRGHARHLPLRRPNGHDLPTPTQNRDPPARRRGDGRCTCFHCARSSRDRL